VSESFGMGVIGVSGSSTRPSGCYDPEPLQAYAGQELRRRRYQARSVDSE